VTAGAELKSGSQRQRVAFWYLQAAPMGQQVAGSLEVLPQVSHTAAYVRQGNLSSAA
jgi:hypothetical protein